jgi:hypothetical protein
MVVMQLWLCVCARTRTCACWVGSFYNMGREDGMGVRAVSGG